METGTTKQRKYIPVHAIVRQLQMEEQVLRLLPGIHSLTGSDSTSYLAGLTKKICWDVSVQHRQMFRGLSEDLALSEHAIHNAEVFFLQIVW